MSSNPGECDTFIRNLRLSASWSVILAFGINIPAGGLWFWYAVYTQTDDGLLPQRLQLLLPLLYIVVSGTFVAGATRTYEQERLKKLGYEQRTYPPLVVDWLLDVAICFSYTHWLGREDLSGSSDRMLIVYMVIGALSVWMGVTLAYMGPIWWFTVRVR